MLTLERQFPSPVHLERAKWAPVLLRPILGSPEQFVIGVAALNERGFHVERANQLNRLECFYGSAASSAILAATIALDDVEDWLAGSPSLDEYLPALSGEEVGDVREGEGHSLREIAASWMGALSSLYLPPAPVALHGVSLIDEADDILDARVERARDRLPEMVMEHLSQAFPSLIRYFSNEVREVKGRRTNASHILIDYSGAKLVANFGTLRPSQYAASVDRIKLRMWDLAIDRDKAKGTLVPRVHEMLVQYPAANDPQITEKQSERISDALSILEEQADQEEIRFHPLQSVKQIAEHLIEKEAA